MVTSASNNFSITKAIALSTFFVFLTFHARGYNLDSTLILEQSRRLVQGNLTGVDFVTPLIIYLCVIPAVLERWLGLPIWVVFNALVAMATIYSMVTITRRVRSVITNGTSDLFLFGLMVFYAYARTTWDFGQRDFLFIILYLPYLFYRVIPSDKPQRYIPMFVGGLAAIGACLKPQFWAAAIVLEMWWIVRAKSSKPLLQQVTVAFFTVSAVYWIHFLFLPHAVREILFGKTLPLLLAGYSAYDLPLAVGLESKRIWFALVVVVGAMVLRNRMKTHSAFLDSLAILTVLCVGVFYQQHKFYSYHNFPALIASIHLALVVGVLVWNWEWLVKRLTKWVFCFAAIVVLLLATWFTPYEPKWETPTLRALIEGDTRRGEPVLVLNTSVNPAFPMLFQIERKQATRFLFPVQFAIFNRDRWNVYPKPERLGPAEREFLNQLGEDIATNRPKLIAIHHEGGLQGVHSDFDLYAYLVASGFINKYMRVYIEKPTVDGYAVFLRNGL